MPRLLASLLVTLFLLLISLAASAAAPAPTAARPAAPASAAIAPAPASAADMARLARENPIPVWSRAGILVEQGGRALYTFANDSTGQSTCDRPCEGLWPPHYAEPGDKPAGPFTIARSFDGRPMWAWKGKPLYRWIGDRKRGAAGGDGVADVWFLVKVPAELASQVVPYFPMPMPRAGTIRTVFPATATPAATATPRTAR
jgi:predicted lipoprotein with Yx(FWY)xxD motif